MNECSLENNELLVLLFMIIVVKNCVKISESSVYLAYISTGRVWHQLSVAVVKIRA